MSASSKFDLSSSSPDRPLYSSTHRGSYGPPSLEKSGSFREDNNPLLSTLPNMTRGSSSSLTQGDVLNFFQCVRLDPKSMVMEHKLNRPEEFKRLASAAVGFQLEDSGPTTLKNKQMSSPSTDDLRRLKAGVRESGTKARERVKIFNDCLSVINKCFPTIQSRKRSRLDALSNERSNTLLSIDRSAPGMGVGKMGSQNRTGTSGFELEQQKSEERTKNSFTNKRSRTSMVHARGEVRVNTRPSGTMDKEREVIRLNSSEDQNLSVAVDGWEKSKMKKKRTGIKSDITAAKPVESYRENKQARQPRVHPEARSRVTDFRSTGVNGGGVLKAEATSQTSSGMRSSVSRTDSENSSLLHDRKERGNLKSVKKANSREDLNSGSPTSGSKLNTNVRGPRSSLVGDLSKLAQVVHRSNDWELSNCTSNKLPTVNLGGTNRKRTPSARSSSPSVTNWAQKISRTARKTNLSPIINDEGPSIKSDNYSQASLSETEESGANEIKSKKCDDISENSGQNVQKMSTLLLPPRKNKAVRTGRGFVTSRPLLPVTGERVGNVGTAKQIRSSRLGVDKSESRTGRPPTRKISDRKAYTRQKPINTTTDFLVGSDDGHEELLAAANAVTNSAQFLSSPFWKKMEPLFRFISDADISYLKDQVNLGPGLDTPAPALLDRDNSNLIPNNSELNKDELIPEIEITLCQRLISALIPEEENQQLFCNEEENFKYDVYESQFETERDTEWDPLMSQSCHLSRYPTSNGVHASGRSFYEVEQVLPGTACSEYQCYNMSMNERLLMEVHSVGIYPDLVSRDKDINGDISRLDEKYQEQLSRKKSLLGKLLSSASEAKEIQDKEFEGRALDKLVEMAYEKYMSCCGRAGGKMAKQASLAFLKRALDRYHEFEMTGKSCFDEGLYKAMFVSGVSLNSNTEKEFGTSRCSVDVRTTDPAMTNQSPSTNQETFHSEPFASPNLGSEQNPVKEDTWSNKSKRREILLDDLCSAKGKRRKSKAKPKQKIAHLSASINGSLGNSEIGKGKNGNCVEDLEEPIDLSALKLPGMEDLGADDFDGQGEDIGSWLDIEDDGLQDHDFMGGLEIPMDDLTDLNMVV